MRKLPLLLGLLACTALTGCDWWSKAPQQQASCHCTLPAPVAAAAPETMRGSEVAVRETTTRTRHYARGRYHERRYADRHGTSRYDWHRREAERSVDIYGYSSSSHVYGGSAYGYGSGHGGDCCEGGDLHARYGETTRVWADGYGRRHIYDQSAVRHYAYQAHVRRADETARLDPWHGYDDDWN